MSNKSHGCLTEEDNLKMKVISPEAKVKVKGTISNETDSEVAGMEAEKDKKRKLHTRRLMLKTLCNSSSLFVLGVMLSIKGPSFIDLQLITGTDVEGGSVFFTAYAFGYMLGSIVAGAMYNRVGSRALLIMIPMVFAGLTCAVTPYCENYLLMVLVHVLNACFSSIFETTANTEEVRHWEGKSDSAMQFLSFTYSLGGIVGPLLVQPFLAPEGNTSIAAPPTAAPQYQLPLQASHTANGSDHHLSPSTNHSPIAAFSSVTNRAQVTSTTPFSPLVLPQLSHVGNGSAFPVRGLTSPCVVSNLSCGSDSSQQPEEVFLDGYSSRIHLPYIIAGIMSIVAALPFCLVYLRSRCKAAAAKKNLAARKVPFDEEEDQKHRQKLPLKVYVMLMGLLSAFYFFYTSVDDPFSMYLSIFVVSHLSWSKESSATVSAVYWVCSTVTKLVMVVLVRHVNANLVMLASTAGMVLSTLLLVVSSSLYVHQLVWLATALLALSQSAIFGGGFAWADSHLLRLDGKVTSCAIFFAALGAMVDPMLIGISMKEISPMAFPNLMLGQSFITFLLFLVMALFARPYVLRHFGPPRGSCNVSLEAPFVVSDKKDFERRGEVGKELLGIVEATPELSYSSEVEGQFSNLTCAESEEVKLHERLMHDVNDHPSGPLHDSMHCSGR